MKEKGFSFIEILFCLFLSTLVMSLLIAQLLAAKKQYLHIKTVVENALELEWIENLLRESIQSAGFTPCLRLDRLVSRDSRTNKTLAALTVQRNKNQGFTVNRMSEHFNSLLKFNADSLTIAANNSYRAGELILIADCYHAEVQEIASVQNLNEKRLFRLKKNCFFTYQKPAYVGKWIEEQFFIQKTKAGKKGLYYGSERADELTSLITQIAIQQQTNQGLLVLTLALRLMNQDSLNLATTVRSL